MRRVVGMLQAVGVNSVPAVGFFAGGWSVGTALALYWCENLLGIFLIAARIALHRKKTRKKGHWLAQIASIHTSAAARKVGDRPRAVRGTGTFLQGFLFTALVFTAGHGLFLALLLVLVFPGQGIEVAAVDATALGQGLAGIAAFLLLGFAVDLPGIARQPFGWVQNRAERMMGRVVVVHLTIVFGLGGMVWFGGPGGLFAVFVALKTLVDLGSWLPGQEKTALENLSEEPPRWLASMTRNLKGHGTDEDFATYWKRTRREEIDLLASYEEVMPAER